MNVHKNARLTPRGREVLISRLKRGEHPQDVSAAMGVSVSTVYKWRRRYRAEGLAGLLDRSSRPKASPNRTPDVIEAKVIALRKERRIYHRIAAEVGVSQATVGRILTRRGLLAGFRPRWAGLARFSGLSTCRPLFQAPHLRRMERRAAVAWRRPKATSRDFTIIGRIRNINPPRSKALLPLFEAVVNSFHAIEEVPDHPTPQIRIEATRERLLDKDELGDFERFAVIDNGSGSGH